VKRWRWIEGPGRAEWNCLAACVLFCIGWVLLAAVR
jgi:hypothetical protein